jgi:hypothetical protein
MLRRWVVQRKPIGLLNLMVALRLVRDSLTANSISAELASCRSPISSDSSCLSLFILGCGVVKGYFRALVLARESRGCLRFTDINCRSAMPEALFSILLDFVQLVTLVLLPFVLVFSRFVHCYSRDTQRGIPLAIISSEQLTSTDNVCCTSSPRSWIVVPQHC